MHPVRQQTRADKILTIVLQLLLLLAQIGISNYYTSGDREMTDSNWTKAKMPSQKGKLAIVTGATGGLGYETALGLAEAGATVIVVGRNDAKGKEALERIKAVVPNADIVFEKADLGSLTSVKEFSDRFNAQHDILDILINNAGVMSPPKREQTVDGFELQFGTNHLSHFALTAHLLPALRKSQEGRVIQVSSFVHKQGKMNFDDLQFEKSYNGWASYAQSKLCNLLFMLELQRRGEEGGWGIKSLAAHPGYARTDIVSNGPGSNDFKFMLAKYFLQPFISQSAADGALPILMAATTPEVKTGDYYGPNGYRDFYGPPINNAFRSPDAKNAEFAKRLWDISVSLTGVKWPE